MIHVDDQELLKRGEAVGDKCEIHKTDVFQLEIYKARSKAYLAALKVKYKASSDAASETQALASKEWSDFLDRELEFLKKSGISKLELRAAEVRFKAMQSALSSRKKEIDTFK